ncbi:ABC transporter ATP-binding protein [Paenibacillus oceani]|jgi:ABC-2 type transport system ATP-binding protein|uniref:ABC transporter ATP-binding protein n=1 Tax=Paenibacillus oceani TaxID=2772510 RepID=A0A927CBA8_9BACL|nr:ABC transporter ATP-binding protein [Paenibacillus oceani]MBD2864279.1 ABC transporter ATP-binding protein [Paenibacillus oceani]
MSDSVNAAAAFGGGKKPVIRAEGLVKRYGSFIAVDNVSFEVHRGEIFGLLGPNGAGKTTTMEMMEGLRRPDEGTAIVAGFDTQKELKKVRQAIGVQLQSTSLFDLLKVKEIVRMYASFYPSSVPIQPLLQDMILEEKKNDRVKHLSGGQRQRLAIALALVNDPEVIFLDEPTTGLDPQARRMLWDIILKLKNRGKTIVLSTHYMDEAHILCDRICLMDKGKVIALDTPERLVRSLHSESAVEFRLPQLERTDLPDEERRAVLAVLESVQGVTGVDMKKEVYVLYTDRLQSTLTDWIAVAGARGLEFADLRTRTATLEDVFIHMTGRSLREE